ncbi:MAG: triacylglycerol lipase [Polyangiales bacterium]
MRFGAGLAISFLAWVVGCSGAPATDQPTFDGGRDARPDVRVVEADPPDAADPSGPPYPVVLCHGMGGFGTLKGLPITYFNGVRDDLATRGETMVFTTLVPAYDSSEVRAKALAPQIDEILRKTGKAKVNLVGHSQGGTDLRVLASPNGLAYGDRIASVTTVATPHRGSQVADVALRILDPGPGFSFDGIANGLLKVLERAVYELDSDPNLKAQVIGLSEHYMVTTFNPKYVDDARVQYFSYGGRTNSLDGHPDCDDALYPDDPSKLSDAQPFLQTTASWLEQGSLKKANDGLVTVQSAKWGSFLQCIPADHMSEVGQLNLTGADPKSGYDHLAFFRLVVSRIRDRGL